MNEIVSDFEDWRLGLRKNPSTRWVIVLFVGLTLCRSALAEENVEVAITPAVQEIAQPTPQIPQTPPTPPSITITTELDPSIKLKPNEKFIAGFLSPVPIDHPDFERYQAEGMEKMNEAVKAHEQEEIAKAEREGYVLNMDGKKYGRPDVLAKEAYRESMTYVDEQGNEQTFGDANGNLMTKEEWTSGLKAGRDRMIAEGRERLEELRRTVHDKALLAELEHETEKFEAQLKADNQKDESKWGGLARKNQPFAVPANWSAEKLNVYHRAKDMGIALFENEDNENQTTKSDNSTAESEKEEPKPAPPAPKVLVSREAGA